MEPVFWIALPVPVLPPGLLLACFGTNCPPGSIVFSFIFQGPPVYMPAPSQGPRTFSPNFSGQTRASCSESTIISSFNDYTPGYSPSPGVSYVAGVSCLSGRLSVREGLCGCFQEVFKAVLKCPHGNRLQKLS